MTSSDRRAGVVVLVACGLTLGLQYFPWSHVSDDACISFRISSAFWRDNPVNDAMGNVEAFERMRRGER